MLGVKPEKKNNLALLAFTLAEVLIVLGIIGIVAEMTIPTLVRNTQKQVLKSSFKKAYSTMSEAIALTKVDLDSSSLNVDYATYNGSAYPHADEFTTAFYKKLKVSGDQNYAVYPVTYNKAKNADWLGIGLEAPPHLLPDGSSVYCNICGSQINVSVDVNGPSKKPNRVGYDIFSFHVNADNNLQANGPQSGMYECNAASTTTYNGLGCSYQALIDKNADDPTKGYWDSLK